MAILTNAVSSFIDSQAPEFIQSQDPNFIAFVRAYYEWMEDSNTGNSLYQSRNLSNYFQIDETTDEFIQYFKKDFLPFFPNDIALDERKLLKTATKFYQTKGSAQSIKFLFRVLYNKDVEIFYPKQNILRVSDGKWHLPQSVKITLSQVNLNFDVQALVGRLGVGSLSNTTCVIEAANKTVDAQLNKEIVELYISSVNRSFLSGENLKITYGTDPQGNPEIFQEKIIGSISNIVVDPKNQGLRYVGTKHNPDGSISYPGDPVVISGGLANSNDVIQAVAYVGNVTTGQLQSITVIDGGYGYRLDPNTLVTVVNAPSDNTGAGAMAIVNSIDAPNGVSVFFNTDSIEYKAAAALNSVNYHFANVANSNINSIMANVFSTINLFIAPMRSMNLINGGTAYSAVPTVKLLSVFDTDFASDLLATYQAAPTQANFNNYINARAAVRDIGRIAAVEIFNGGTAYSNTTDKIVVDSTTGYGATFDFITDVSGSITSVIVTAPGYGYPPRPTLMVANSANYSNVANGTGASFQAFGDNDGEDLSISVSDIGRVETVRLVDHGFDYVSTPIVSLRVQDVTIQPLSNSQFYFQGETVYQGANVNTASFLAFVDSYDRSNSILRIYNYVGTLNVNSNLIGANQNASPISTKAYGNGKARANAIFLNGLINYPGFYLSTDGFLSADQFLQDGVKYHNYSYILQVEEALKTYKQTLMQIAHPAGMKMLGLYTIVDHNPAQPIQEWEPIQFISPDAALGALSVNAYANGITIGSSTQFIGNVHVGDLIVLDHNSVRSQTKEVINVIDNNTLLLESNTSYPGPDRISTTTGSNVIVSSAVTSNLRTGDIINTNIGGNAQTSLVVGFSGPNVTVNTVFGSNTSNILYMAYPSTVNVNYEIISTHQLFFVGVTCDSTTYTCDSDAITCDRI